MRKETILFILLLSSITLISQSLVDSKHNLSANGPGRITADSEQGVCIFCHTPHNARNEVLAPLWNKADNSGTVYTIYDQSVSSTLQNTQTGQPDGSSMLCLSCHDGTIALGELVSRTATVAMSDEGGSITTMTGAGNLTTDLSDDHPVSFVYDVAIPGKTKDPSTLPATMQLEGGKVQCVTCHDPHKNVHTNFLVESKLNSAICMNCHDKTNWVGSAHQSSTATWNGTGTNPWAHVGDPYNTVAENACSNCHDTHNAGSGPWLMKGADDDQTCTPCHNGNTATADIQSQTLKMYSHNIPAYAGIHDPAEDPTSNDHVSCRDCHNPHEVISSAATVPAAAGSIQNMPGMDINGVNLSSINNQYELCFRCHGDTWASTPNVSPVPRQYGNGNVRMDFQPSNISNHPVANTNKGNSSTLRAGAPSQVYCTDCHASDGTGAPNGPHGSIYPKILKKRYFMSETLIDWEGDPSLPGMRWNGNETQLMNIVYELCFDCHQTAATYELHDAMKSDHHIEYATCHNCHDPHGVPGGVAGRNENLLNLNTNSFSPNSQGNMFFDLNNRTCNFICHVNNHSHRGSRM